MSSCSSSRAPKLIVNRDRRSALGDFQRSLPVARSRQTTWSPSWKKTLSASAASVSGDTFVSSFHSRLPL